MNHPYSLCPRDLSARTVLNAAGVVVGSFADHREADAVVEATLDKEGGAPHMRLHVVLAKYEAAMRKATLC